MGYLNNNLITKKNMRAFKMGSKNKHRDRKVKKRKQKIHLRKKKKGKYKYNNKKNTKKRKIQQKIKNLRNFLYTIIPYLNDKKLVSIRNKFNECFSIKGIYLNIISFLGSFKNKYVITKRTYNQENRRYNPDKLKSGDKYIYHLSDSNIGIGCRIINFYIKNNDVVPYIRKISLLNKSCKDISSEIFTLKCSKHNKIDNNILYKIEALKFYNKYPKFFDHEHTCEKYNISEIPDLCITRCEHLEFQDNCNYCQAKHETPYTCDCNGFYKRDFTAQYTNISCDECAILDVDSVPENVTRNRDYCRQCRAGLSDMYQDMADDARDDY